MRTIGGEDKKGESKEDADVKGSQEHPQNQWRIAFNGVWNEFSKGWLPDFTMTILSLTVFGAIFTFIMNSQKGRIIGFGIGITVLTWVLVVMMLRHLPSDSSESVKQDSTSLNAPTATPILSVHPTETIRPSTSAPQQNAQSEKPSTTKEQRPEAPSLDNSIRNSPIINSPGSIQSVGDNVTINQAPPPRSITQQQKAAIRAGLQAFKGQSLVVITPEERETQAYAVQIGNAIGSAGLRVEVLTIGSILPPPYGVTYYASASSPPALLAPLLSTFRRAGIEIKRDPHLNAVPESAHAPNALVAIQIGHRE